MATRRRVPATAKKTRKAPAQAETVPIEHAIAGRAYELFLERGGEHGRDWEDWLSAERELLFAER